MTSWRVMSKRAWRKMVPDGARPRPGRRRRCLAGLKHRWLVEATGEACCKNCGAFRLFGTPRQTPPQVLAVAQAHAVAAASALLGRKEP